MSGTSRHAGRPRLKTIAEMVPPGSRVLDVGTDRALLPRYLLATGRAAFCIASERDPVRLARVPASCWAFREKLDLRAGDGLTVLDAKDRIEVVIVAGLGSRSILRILEQRDLTGLGIRRLVLQPETAPSLVRRWLEARDFGIVDERLVEEGGRFFTIIAAEPGRPPAQATEALTRDDVLEVGPCLLRSGDGAVARYWQEELRRNQEILDRHPTGRGRAEALRRRDLALRLLPVTSPSIPGSP